MNKCWKFKRSKSAVQIFKTDNEIFLNRDINNLKLRNYDKNNLDKKESKKKLTKIKPNIKIKTKK